MARLASFWERAAILVGTLLALHLVFTLNSPLYSEYASLSHIYEVGVDRYGQGRPAKYDQEEPGQELEPESSRLNASSNTTSPARRKANAVFVILVRNSELWQIVDSIKQMEDRFNSDKGYEYVFLNDVPFEEKFKKYTQRVAKAKCHYGLIEPQQWKQPDWIDEAKAKAARESMAAEGVIYGDSQSYRSMCSYNSGYFFRHPLLEGYDYYWRIEPDVKFFCDIVGDPFLYMLDHKKVYGFTISLYEFAETIPTLWDTVKDFVQKHPDYVAEDNAMEFISGDGGETYNRCHFWSNFEIADLNFWRSDAYLDFFNHLEQSGGFWYERWGDAPVHSIAASLFLPKTALHYFNNIGYRHSVFQHCPQGELHAMGRCWCDESDDFEGNSYSCTNRYLDVMTH